MFGATPMWEESLAGDREDEVPAAKKHAENVIGMKAGLEARLAGAAQTQATMIASTFRNRIA